MADKTTTLRYVIEVSTDRIPHRMNENKELVVAVEAGGRLLTALKNADFSLAARNKLEHATGVRMVSVEIVE